MEKFSKQTLTESRNFQITVTPGQLAALGKQLA